MAELISICMATHNRKPQLMNSLRAISWHTSKNNTPVEVVIVDDDSDETFTKAELRKFHIPITYKIRKGRTRQDPVIPNNMAFDLAKGDIFIMSCGEILMLDNVIEHAYCYTGDRNFNSYGVYSVDWEVFGWMQTLNWKDRTVLGTIKERVNELAKTNFVAGVANGWYIHSLHRNLALPFCASITRTNMEKLSGYDERFMFGVGSADVDFLRRINELKLECLIFNEPLTVHQPHQWTDYTNGELFQFNINLLNELSASHNIKAEENLIYKR